MSLIATACAEVNVAAPGAEPSAAAASRGLPPSVIAYAEAEAMRLPPCGVAPLAEGEGAEVVVKAAPLRLRLPAGASHSAQFPVDGFETWSLSDSTALTLTITEGGSFYIGGDDSTVHVGQGECAMRIAGRVAAVSRYLLLPRGETDTVFVATADVPVRAGFWINAGVLGRSDAGRAQALAALRTVAVEKR